ncbi:MAG: DUF2218 domain-containing protein [Parasphingorhabdus sp.]
MINSKSNVPTDKASKYLQQMCNHFGHKTDVVETDGGQAIQFGFGAGELVASEDTLVLIARAESDENLTKTENVLGSHLERFAFRENLSVTWQRS